MKTLITCLRKTKRLVFALVSATVLMPTVASAQGMDYPNQPITIVIAYSKGGPTDKIASPLARELSEELGQDVTVKYVTGKGGTQAPAALAANPDPSGHTLLLHHIGMATAPSLYRRLAYQPEVDFIPIGRIADAPMILMTRNQLTSTKVKIKSFIRDNQDSLTLGYAGVGSASQMCGLMLQKAFGVSLMWIPFQGTKPAMRDLAAGRIDLLCDQTTQAITAIDAGKADPMFLTASNRLKLKPDLPTGPEASVDNAEISIWHALYASKGTPRAIVTRLETALSNAVQKPRFMATMDAVGVQITNQENRSAAALARHLRAETRRWAPIIRSSGMYATE